MSVEERVVSDDTMVSGKQWVALYTKPHKEYLVRDLLRRQGVEVYLPEVAVAVRRRDRRKWKPFFPHYLFARFDSDLMPMVRWTPGMRRVVSAGGQPVAVSDEVVAHIRRRVVTMVETEPESPFKQGDVVCIQHGTFEGWDAIFDCHLSPEGRVRVFLQCMSRLVATELDVGDLLPR